MIIFLTKSYYNILLYNTYSDDVIILGWLTLSFNYKRNKPDAKLNEKNSSTIFDEIFCNSNDYYILK